MYRDSRRVFETSKKGRPCKLPPLEEFFLTMVCLWLGLLEQDIAYCFGISQPVVFTTWINFMDLQFKRIPLWPPQQPALPELQQLTFSTYNNHNTYKGIIGISPQIWCCEFLSKLFLGSTSDKEFTRIESATARGFNNGR